MSDAGRSSAAGAGAGANGGYYVARRQSRGVGNPASRGSPLQSPVPSAGAALSTTSSQNGGGGAPGSAAGGAVPPLDLSGKSKEELIRLATKLGSELSIKNKIIYDLRAKENWLSAELMAAGKGTDPQQQQHHSADADGPPIPDGFSPESSEFEQAKAKLFQKLLYFKKELNKAKQAVEQNTNLLRESERLRESAQEEAQYLQSLLQSLSNGGDGRGPDIERQRMIQLETSLKAAQNEISTLQSKVSLWARASKKNQEARIQAEACQRNLESEAATLRGLVAQSKDSEEKQRQRANTMEAEVYQLRQSTQLKQKTMLDTDTLRLRNRELEVRLSEQGERLKASENVMEAARQRISEFEKTMQDAYGAVERLEQDNDSLRADVKSRDARIKELLDRLETLQTASDSGTRRLAENLQDTESRSAELSERVERLDVALREMTRERDFVGKQAAEAQAELQDARAELEAMSNSRRAIEAELAATSTALADMQTTCEDMRGELDAALAREARAAKDLRDADARAREAGDLHAREGEAAFAAREELDAARQDLLAARERLGLTAAALEAAEAQLHGQAQQLERARGELAELQEEMSSATQTNKALEVERMGLLDQVERLESELQAERALSHSSQSEAIENLRSHYEEEIDGLRKQRQELESQ
ncbi:hypothetical protein HK405_012438, partial [Cladochytrium tenue]